MPPPRQSGFAMLDVLVALLLLAVTLTGACSSLIHAMRATQESLFATRAVDLAADLAEEARMAGTTEAADAMLAAWRERVRAALPVTGLEPEQFASLNAAPPDGEDEPAMDAPHQVLTLRWRGVSGQLEELTLPLAAMALPATP